MIRPSKSYRIENGHTYPDDDRAPPGSHVLHGRLPSIREAIASFLGRVGIRLLRPRNGDVLAVIGGTSLTPTQRERIVKNARRAGLEVAIFLPPRCRVHTEPTRKSTEDLGYRETTSYGNDKEVYVGTPDDVPDTDPCAA